MKTLVTTSTFLAAVALSALAATKEDIHKTRPAQSRGKPVADVDFGSIEVTLAKAMEGKAVPAMAMLRIRDFKPEPEAVRGVRCMGQSAPVRPGDRWHLGSDGKPMTATLIAHLVEKGVLSWNAPLERILPRLAASMRPEYRDVTLQDLLSHRAGLPENHEDQNLFFSFYDDKRPLPEQRMSYITAALKDAPIGPKRAERKYSNTGFIIAGFIAEQATGKPYERLMLEEVFEPLGIKSANFDQTGGPEEPCGHVDGRLADRPHDANPKMFSPAGGICMTLDDWARFCIDQMEGFQGKGKLLKTETYRLLQTAQGNTRTGLGWGISPTVLGRNGPALTHSGSDGNWYAIVVLFPETGNGLLAATNAGESMGGDKATSQLARELVPSLSPPAPEPRA